jgi:hypothetical protein
VVAHLTATVAAPTLLLLVRKDILTKDLEVGLVSSEGEHDEIGVKSVDNVLRVGVVGRVSALTTDEVHDLVLSFSGDGGVGDDDLELF